MSNEKDTTDADRLIQARDAALPFSSSHSLFPVFSVDFLSIYAMFSGFWNAFLFLSSLPLHVSQRFGSREGNSTEGERQTDRCSRDESSGEEGRKDDIPETE